MSTMQIVEEKNTVGREQQRQKGISTRAFLQNASLGNRSVTAQRRRSATQGRVSRKTALLSVLHALCGEGVDPDPIEDVADVAASKAPGLDPSSGKCSLRSN
jgi:hypothetical protein